jgi:acetylornithine deacetylase/succinyl-diaminopimelate desuccinylase
MSRATSAEPDQAGLVDLLERLVAINTQNPPGREAEAAALLASGLADIGFATEVRPVAEGRANVVARLDNGDGPCFAFNSHLDTVPVGGGWTSDPLRLTERHGRLFGRGACDAKGSIAAMVEAGRMLLAQRDAWRGTLLLAFVADEEIDGIGAKALMREPPPIDLVVVGEPTSNAVCAAHKGCLRPLIRAGGRAAHSGAPELGVNAILAAGRLLSLVDERDRELRTHRHPLVGAASLTVTRIAGGIADNIVPDSCEIVLDRRLLPGETVEAALGDLCAMLARAKSDHGVEAELVTVRSMAGPAETPLDEPIVRDAVAIASRHGVTLPQPSGLTGGCDLVHFREAGSVGVVLGPGSLGSAHQPDEYVPKDDLVRAAVIYRDIAAAAMRP